MKVVNLNQHLANAMITTIIPLNALFFMHDLSIPNELRKKLQDKWRENVIELGAFSISEGNRVTFNCTISDEGQPALEISFPLSMQTTFTTFLEIMHNNAIRDRDSHMQYLEDKDVNPYY